MSYSESAAKKRRAFRKKKSSSIIEDKKDENKGTHEFKEYKPLDMMEKK
jgi:hypothetical protein